MDATTGPIRPATKTCVRCPCRKKKKKKKIVASTVYQTTVDRVLVICNDENEKALLLAGRICTGCYTH